MRTVKEFVFRPLRDERGEQVRRAPEKGEWFKNGDGPSASVLAIASFDFHSPSRAIYEHVEVERELPDLPVVREWMLRAAVDSTSYTQKALAESIARHAPDPTPLLAAIGTAFENYAYQAGSPWERVYNAAADLRGAAK